MKSVDERGIQRRTHSQYELAVMNEWDIDEEEGYSTTYELVVQYNPAGIWIWYTHNNYCTKSNVYMYVHALSSFNTMF